MSRAFWLAVAISALAGSTTLASEEPKVAAAIELEAAEHVDRSIHLASLAVYAVLKTACLLRFVSASSRYRSNLVWPVAVEVGVAFWLAGYWSGDVWVEIYGAGLLTSFHIIECYLHSLHSAPHVK